MSYRFFLILTLFSIFSWSQKSDFVATYNLKYKVGKADLQEQQILLINTKNNESYFLSSPLYVMDSLIINKKYVSSFENMEKYDSMSKSKIHYKNDSFTVYESIGENTFHYDENYKLTWTITNEKQVKENMTGRKATTKAFGRTWTAWFAENTPINFAPHKFNGLPGLVYAVYDEKNEISFTLTQFKKVRRGFFINSSKSIKTSKNKLPSIRYNYYVNTLLNIQYFDSAKDKQDEKEKLEKSLNYFPRIE